MSQLFSSKLARPPRKGARNALITEEQIVLMDESHYMSQAQLDFFKARLVAVEEMLIARMRSGADEIATSAAEADPADRASAEEEHQLAIAARARDRDQLVQVQAALARIESGDFGWCIETGEMIGVERLLVCPTALLCVEAQQRRESKQSRFRS